MKAVVACLFICQLAAIPAHSQGITVNLVNKPLKFILRNLSSAGHCNFAYHDDDIRFDNVTLQANNLSLADVLTQLFRDIPVRWIFVNINKDGDSCFALSQMQSRSFAGRVINETGEPQAGITVSVLHTDIHATTDERGQFQLCRVWDNSVVSVSGINIVSENRAISELSSTDITVHRKMGILPRVTVSSKFSNGLGSMSAANYPGSFYKMDGPAMQKVVSTGILAQLIGQTSGLQSDPTVDNSLGISIHGRISLYAVNPPGVVWDGLIYWGNPLDINPNDIQSPNVLKDPVSAGMWGTFAANGIIVFNSHSGDYNDSPRITLTMNYTAQGKPNLFYIPRISTPSYVGMEEYRFRQGDYDPALTDPGYPAVSPVVYLLSQGINHAMSWPDVRQQIRQLEAYDMRRDELTYLYRNSVNQQYHISLSGGHRDDRYYLSGGYDFNPTPLTRNKYDRYTLHADHSYMLFSRHLEITTIFHLAATNVMDNNSGTVPVTYPYGRLADSKGNPLPVDYGYNPGYDTAGGGRLLPRQYLPLQELALADNSLQRLAWHIQLKADYHINTSLSVSIEYRYCHSNSWTRDLYSQQGFYARDLINRFTEINGQNIVHHIPIGDILHKLDTTIHENHLRGLLSYISPKGRVGHIEAMAGADLNDQSVTGSDHWLYGYDPRTGSSIPVDLADSFPDYVTGNPEQIPGDGQPLGLYTRYVSFFSNLSYTYRDQYSLYGGFRKDATNIVGTEANRQWSPFWSLGAGWEITRNLKQPSHLLPLLKVRLTYGCNGNVGNRIANLQTQTLVANQYGAAESGIASAPDPGLTWEKTYVFNTGFDFALLQDQRSSLGRLHGSLDVYFKHSVDLLGNDSLPPSAGLQVFFGNTAAMTGKGLDLVLNSDNIRGRFKWTTTYLLNWVTDRVTRYLFQPSANADYVSEDCPKVGQSSTALFAYRWAGLDPANGNPRGYLNHQTDTDYLAIMNSPNGEMHVHGSYLPLISGGILNTFTWENFTLSALMTFKADYWFRRPSIDYNRMFTGQYAGVKDYDERWQKPGDEKHTSVPSFPQVNDPQRDLFYQNADVLVTRGDHLRWQSFRLDYLLTSRRHPRWRFHQADIYTYINNIGLIWKANHYGIDPDASVYGTMPAVRSYSIGMKTTF